MFSTRRPHVSLDDRSAIETPHSEYTRVQSKSQCSHSNRNLAVEELLHSNNREYVQDSQNNILRQEPKYAQCWALLGPIYLEDQTGRS